MNPSSNYSWSNTAQWSQAGGSQTSNPATQMNNQTNMPSNFSPQQTQESGENRSEMISRLYKTILGREADTAGLNYFLYNTHLTEYQIAREMIESTEHNEILSKARDIRQMVHKTEEVAKRMNDMEFTLQNLQTLNENYKNLIDQKTQTINELRAQLNLPNEGLKSHDIHDSHPSSTNLPNNSFQEYSQSDFILNDPFAEEYSNRPGCLGWIKSWFKFN